MSVSVASDKRFRRAHVAPARRGARSSRMAMAAPLVLVVVAVVAAHLSGRRTGPDLGRPGRPAHQRRRQRAHVARRDRGRARGAGRREHPDGRPRRRGGSVSGARRGWPTRSVRRIFPSTIRVVVEEREPIGIGRLGDQLFLVDRTGTIIDEFGPGYAALDLPVIDGLSAGTAAARRWWIRSAPGWRGRLLRSLERSPHLVKRISQIDVADPRDAAVILEGDAAVVRLGHELFAERLQSYVDVAEALRDTRGRHRLRGPAVRRARLRAPPRGRRAQHPGSGQPGAVAGPGPLENNVARRERYLVGLDVGTSTVCCVVGEALDDGRLDVVGIGVAESRGIKRGVVVNLEAAVESIKKAIEEAELMAGRRDRHRPPVALGPAHQGLQQPRRDCRGRQEPRDHARRRQARHRRRQGRVAAHRPRDPPRAAAGLRGGRPGRHRRADRHGRRAAGGQRPRGHRRGLVHAEHRVVREPRRRQRGGHGDRAAGGGRRRADRRREGAGRGARGHRRRHRRHRDLRARQPVAHRRRGARRRPLHQRHRRRAADAGPRRGEAEAQERLRAVVDGGRARHDRRGQRRRPQVAADVAAHPLRDPAAARRRDLPPGVGRHPARRLRAVAQLGDRAHRRRVDPRRAARDRRADLRSADPARRARRAWAAWPITSPARCSRRRSG